MDERDEKELSGISRRSMLKRIGAGAAIAWAAPAVTSLGSKAFAQARGTPVCSEPCGSHGCNGIVQCGSEGAFDFCLCNTTVEGDCACSEITLCDDPNAHACTSSAECASGLRCVVVSGCGAACASAICVYDCGASGQATAAQGTPNSANR